jgi:hypothetical protein
VAPTLPAPTMAMRDDVDMGGLPAANLRHRRPEEPATIRIHCNDRRPRMGAIFLSGTRIRRIKRQSRSAIAPASPRLGSANGPTSLSIGT